MTGFLTTITAPRTVTVRELDLDDRVRTYRCGTLSTTVRTVAGIGPHPDPVLRSRMLVTFTDGSEADLPASTRVVLVSRNGR